MYVFTCHIILLLHSLAHGTRSKPEIMSPVSMCTMIWLLTLFLKIVLQTLQGVKNTGTIDLIAALWKSSRSMVSKKGALVFEGNGYMGFLQFLRTYFPGGHHLLSVCAVGVTTSL